MGRSPHPCFAITCCLWTRCHRPPLPTRRQPIKNLRHTDLRSFLMLTLIEPSVLSRKMMLAFITTAISLSTISMPFIHDNLICLNGLPSSSIPISCNNCRMKPETAHISRRLHQASVAASRPQPASCAYKDILWLFH